MSDANGSAGAGNPPGEGGGEQQVEWTNGFDEDTVGYVQNKGWKGPADAVQSYRNAEKLLGAPPDQVLRLPKEGDTEAWSQVYSRLGRPVDPKGYEIEVPEGGDPAFAEWAKGAFHEIGLSTAQASKLAAKWNELAAGKAEEAGQSYAASVQAEEAALRKEWGAAYEKHVEQAKAAARTFGLEAEQIDAMEKALGFGGLMKMMHNIGSRLGEDTFEGSGSGNFNGAVSPAQAKAEIGSLQVDRDFMAAYLDKGNPGHASAVERMTRLMGFAYPE